MNLSITKKTLLFGTVLISQLASAGRVYKYPAIYPFIPMDTNKIYKDVTNVTEDQNFIRNLYKIENNQLTKAKTKIKPWTSTYWPLGKGGIADPYEDSKFAYYVDFGWINWEQNYNAFLKRKEEFYPKIDELEQEELDKLAPSEKYDLLLGDRSFDLTNRLWEYTQTWGSKKEFGFISRLYLVNEDALSLAKQFVNWGWFKDLNQAFKDSYQLQGSLSVDNALKLVKAGKYKTVEQAFPEALKLAKEQEGEYVLTKVTKRIAGWEGICNGWSTAAGNIPRPRKTVSFDLGDGTGRQIRFLPEDIKGLVALYWVNSLIQDGLWHKEDGSYGGGGTVFAGLRCNLRRIKKDHFGRYYDHKEDPYYNKHEPRCVGVHPATWHLGLVNIIGKQGRSFVVERKVTHEVDNHPMYKYEMKYFNPNNGKYMDELWDNIEVVDENDQFHQFRNPKTKYIIGVETIATYLNYKKPRRSPVDSEEDDSEVDKKMYYDLELDDRLNIIGGQWRALRVGEAPDERDRLAGYQNRNQRLNHNQPDFFWNVTKKWNTKEVGLFIDEDLEIWKDQQSLPPKSWLDKAKQYHSFHYQQKYEWGSGGKCNMISKKFKDFRKVSCEFSTNRPQPLINIINVLIKKAK